MPSATGRRVRAIPLRRGRMPPSSARWWCATRAAGRRGPRFPTPITADVSAGIRFATWCNRSTTVGVEAMSLDEEYPKTFRKTFGRFRELLAQDTALSGEERENLARALSDMADKARDLDDIATRLLEESHSPQEIGELLIAFELTTEQLRGSSDDIDGKLYEIGDRLKAPTDAAAPPPV